MAGIGSSVATGAAAGSIFGIPGAAIGAGIGLLGGLFGGLEAGRKRKQQQNLLNQEESDNQAWYDANALSDYTQRADAQNLIRNMKNNLAQRDSENANMSVVSGATPEQQATAKQQTDNVISNVYGNLGAMGQQWKDQITNQYLGRKYSLGNQNFNMLGDQAKSYENLMGNGLNDMTSSIKSLAS